MGGVSGFAVEVQNVGGVFSVLIVACAAPAGSVRPVGSERLQFKFLLLLLLSQKSAALAFSMSLRTCKAQPFNISAKKQDYFTFSWRKVHIYSLIGGKMAWKGCLLLGMKRQDLREPRKDKN